MERKQLLRKVLAPAAAFLAAAGIGLGIYLSQHPGLLAKPEKIRGQVDAMLQCICAQDYQAAGRMMHPSPSFGPARKAEDPLGQLLWEAFSGSLTYTMTEPCRAEGSGVVQNVTITCLDLETVNRQISDLVPELLQQRIAEAETVAEIYDENNAYREDLIRSLWSSAAESVLEDAPMMTTELQVRLAYREKQWMILPDGELLRVITGGVWDATPAENLSLMDLWDGYVHLRLELVLERVEELDKIFWLRDTDPIAPKPNPACFGSTTDPSSLQWLLDEAAELLDGQKTLFSTDIEILPDSEVVYYLDDTILSITWQQSIDGVAFAMSEVKIAHPSQFRRYFVEDTYGVPRMHFGTDLAAQVNAVTASNGDYYLRRDYGVVVYNGQVHRANRWLDVCFIDDKGDLILVHQGQIADQETAERFVEENNIRFSLAFGPIMVENGQNVTPDHYTVGEIAGYYSRAGLGTLGELHYLIATNGKAPRHGKMMKLTDFADRMIAFGCDKAYSLDGGQTALIVTNDKIMSFLTFRVQRRVSDIIYFATAIPDGT